MIEVSVITSAHNVADARLHRLTNALVASGLSVEVIALGQESDAPDGVEFRSAPGVRGIRDRLVRDFLLPFRARGHVVITLAPDLIPMAFLVTRLRKRSLVTDVYEDYEQLLKDRKWARGIKGKIAIVVARFATKYAARAELTTVADVQVPPFRANRRLVVRNLPDLSFLKPSGEMDAAPRAIYIGDVRSSRGLRTMLEIANHCPAWTFDIVGSVAPEDQKFVDQWLSHSPNAARVHFYGRLAPTESWNIAQGAWVGLSLLQSTPAFVAAMPSKLYEYMTIGLAVVSTPLPRCEVIINESRSGFVSADTKEISQQLNSWATDPEPLKQLRQNAATWAADHFDSGPEYRAFAAAIKSLTAGTR